jgi:DNA helicase IV
MPSLALALSPTFRIIEREFTGPARVSGSAGAGKTIVALHRAVRLAKTSTGPVLLATFSQPLAARTTLLAGPALTPTVRRT